MKIRILIWSKLRQVRTLVEIVVKNGLTLTDLKLNNRQYRRQIELLIDKSVKPVAQRQRKIPFHLRAKVDSELNRLQQEDIIEKVPDNEETDWISPVVIVHKQDEQIRLCVDMRAANTAIKRVCHPIPTVRDISLDLNGA